MTIKTEEIAEKYLAGDSLRCLAKSYGISHEAVRRRLLRIGVHGGTYEPEKNTWRPHRRPIKKIPKQLYDATLNAQGGLCGICHEKRKLCIDQCRTGGRFRGLICSRCGFLLWVIENSTKTINNASVLVAAAIRYMTLSTAPK